MGHKLVPSKLGAVKKDKINPMTGAVTRKVRIILDCKQSGLTSATVKTHKSCLPRISHAVRAILGMMDEQGLPEGVEISLFIADISDAFWLIPLHPEERRFFCAKLCNKILVFQRTAQGSRSAPLTWAAIAAIVARLTQSVLMTNRREHRGRLQLYVDDPLLAVKGAEAERRRAVVKFMITLMILGSPVAVAKAKYHSWLTWIGVQIKVLPNRVEVTIPEEKVTELVAIIRGMLEKNVIPVKKLRTLAGKSTHIASLILVWRPFLNQLWAAISSEGG